MTTGHILLIGFMGAGKSTVGREVASRLGLAFVDLDERVEQATGSTIPEIFEREGEGAFRAAERAALEALAGSPRSVVACGGGIVLDDANRTTLATLGRIVYLEVSPEEAIARIGDTAGRPLLAGDAQALATRLLDARRALYEATADMTVSTAGRTPHEVADEVVGLLTGEAA